MSTLDTHPEPLSDDSATLQSQRLWKSAGERDLDFDSQRLRNRLRAKMFGVDAAPLRIGRFTVLETVGSGGMGVVYAAYDEQLDRRVAVKLLRAAREDDASIGKGRLLREAQALAKLSHPNVVQVYEVGTFDDRVFLAMEFLAGPNLRAWLLDEPRPWPVVLRHFIEAGQGLAAAHEHGIIHRDFKPANLLFGAEGRIRVVDFGLARASTLDRLELVEAGPAGTSLVFSTELTQTGEIMGTPAYMSPEQARHEAVDARSDQYSFCVALYEALFGTRPHTGRSTAEVLVAVAEGNVSPPPRNTKIPSYIVRAVMRGLSADPAHRFASMSELLAQLSPRERGRRWRILGIGAIAASGLGALASSGAAPCPSFEGVIADAWSSQSRAAIEAAFEHSGAPGAAATLEIVDRHVGAYAEQWLAARHDACEAHYVTRAQSAELHDLRVACLAERHAELAALAEGLAVADPEVVEQAPRAVTELSPIEECNDLDTLQRRRQSDPVRQEMRVRLAQAQAQYKLGHYERALQALDVLAEAARLHGAPELEAASLFHRGTIHQRRRVHDAANAAFEQTIDLAEEGEDDELVARAWIHLAQGQAILDDAGRAESSLRRAQAKVRRLGDDARLEHELDAARVVAAWQAGRLDDAIAGQTRVVARVQAELGVEHPHVADAELRLAHILGDAARHEDAQSGYLRALDTLARVYGPEHPALARVWFDIGMDHRGAGHADQAKAAFEEAERRFVAALGERAPELLDIDKALAYLAQQRGDLEEAERRIHEHEQLAQGVELPLREALDMLSLRAMVASQRRDHAGAADVCRTYFERVEGTAPSPATELQALFMRAVFIDELGALGHHDEAELHARALLDALAKQDEATASELRPHAWQAIGRAAEARSDLTLAATAYRTGLELLGEPDPQALERVALRARLGWGLARVLLPSDARAAVESAVAARQRLALAEPEAAELSEIDAWLRAAG